jgi:threonine synthase
MPPWPGVLERYRSWLSIPEGTPAITLLEGNTPLIDAPRLARLLGAAEVHVKFEGLNPTGSFKDRGMTVAVSVAVGRGARTLVCASTGNTAASAAAYAARAGLRCVVVIPKGQVAAGKLAGAAAYGAETLQIEASFDQALELVKDVTNGPGLAMVNSLNPDRLEGQKTAAFEIEEDLRRTPDWVALPVGNAGNLSAYSLGFTQLARASRGTVPRFLGAQAAGAAPLVLGHPVDRPQTVASAIRIGRPARGEQALQAAYSSGGRIVAVPDESILAAQAQLAAEGIWVEPASAAGLAALEQECSAGRIDLNGVTAVIICTGHGLKDPQAAPGAASTGRSLPADRDALLEALQP